MTEWKDTTRAKLPLVEPVRPSPWAILLADPGRLLIALLMGVVAIATLFALYIMEP